MNKNLMSVVSRTLAALNTLFHQANKLTLLAVTEDLPEPGKFEEFIDSGTLMAEPLEKLVEDDPLTVRIHADGTPALTYDDWVRFRRHVDACFLDEHEDLVPHIDAEVLYEAETAAHLLRAELWDRVEDLEAKREQAKSYADKAEEMYFPDRKKPLGPLFGDQPQDEAEMEVEEFDPTKPEDAAFPLTDEESENAVSIDVAEEMAELELGEAVGA